ncbi:efflux RND transporter periplasmic adaptor subunit [Streptomyces sp. NPDC001941]|uniref:efflux RND transporter periplasmic adaptor subunit n=1 Tax=Streptomyces sp. NPDC001941 TaxID=3154659 RepID=UPI00331FC763
MSLRRRVTGRHKGRAATVYGVLGAVLVGGGLATLRAEESSAAPSAPARAEASPAARTPVAGTDPSASGTLASAATRSLAFSTGGTLTTLAVKAGQKVAKGDVLARTDSTEAVESRQAAYSSYLAASEALDAADDSAHSRAYASYVKARNAYHQARRAVEGTEITAPFSGTVTAVDAAAGQSVNAGTAVLTLTDLTRLTVTADFTEADVVRLDDGQKASVTFDSLGTAVTGTVSSVSPVPVAAASSGGGSGGGTQSSTQVVRYAVEITPERLPATARAGQAVTVEVHP